MEYLSNEDLSKIKGGSLFWAYIALAIGGIVSFAIGVIDGYKRPKKCN